MGEYPMGRETSAENKLLLGAISQRNGSRFLRCRPPHGKKIGPAIAGPGWSSEDQ